MITTKNIWLFAISLMTTIATSSLAFAEMEQGKNAIQVDLGYTSGGMSLGLDYEHGHDRTYGIGGYFRMVPDNDTPAADGYTTIGVFVRPHFNRANWDLFLSPGLGLIFYDPASAAADEEDLLGPSLQTGVLYEVNPKTAWGFDVFQIWSWFGEDDYRGQLAESIFSAKFRYVF